MILKMTVSQEDVEKLQFRIERVSDRQKQPMDFADKSYWPHALDNKEAWKHYRWDMFMVDALMPMSEVELSIRMEKDGQEQYFYDSKYLVLLERFFIAPVLQNPSKFEVQYQPNSMDPSSHVLVHDATQAWFKTRPECEQLSRWTISAMDAMRSVLVLADQFDVEWWTKYQDNVDVLFRYWKETASAA